MELLTDMVRWLHVVAAMAWLGFAFHTRELERKTKSRECMPAGSVGEVWSIHGFGFYRTVKYLTPPKEIPATLVWYKWQARTTWFTGFALMGLIYYRGADLYLLAASDGLLSASAAISISIGGLGLSWLIYNALYRSRAAKREATILSAVFLLLAALAYTYSELFSPRGALIQMGATMATWVIANIFFVIFPVLRTMIVCGNRGEPPPQAAIERGTQRGRHNNYMVLSIVFLMVSNHFPTALAARPIWLLIMCIVVVGGVIRYFFDTMHETGRKLWWTWGLSFVLMLSVAAWSEVAKHRSNTASGSALGSFVALSQDDGMRSLILSRCAPCHAKSPTWPGLGAAPKGAVFESSREITSRAAEIHRAVFVTRTMPPGNVTGMTEFERAELARWLAVKAADEPH